MTPHHPPPPLPGRTPPGRPLIPSWPLSAPPATVATRPTATSASCSPTPASWLPPGLTGSPTWPKPPADPSPASGPPIPITTSALPGTLCRPSAHPPCPPRTPETAAMTDPACPFERLSSVKNPLTLNRRGRPVENDEYAAFVRRVLRAYARRVADGDV